MVVILLEESVYTAPTEINLLDFIYMPSIYFHPSFCQTEWTTTLGFSGEAHECLQCCVLT